MILETPADATSPESLLYENVAEQITQLIDRGTLRPGERIPSVRKLSRQRRVSISTILQAYRVLENRGLIEARPQSGYFVRVKTVDAACGTRDFASGKARHPGECY